MHSAWFRSTFLRVLKFLQIKEGGPNFWGEPILKKVWIIWSALLYINFKSLMDTISTWFIRFECIIWMYSAWFRSTFCTVMKFVQIKEGGPNFCEYQFCRKSELFGPPFGIYNLKVLWPEIHSRSLDFNAFCMIHEYISRSLEISTNKRRRKQFCRMSELFGPPFCISISKVF